ncbi:hypothetical protein STEG23_014666, partial [Scotinomys teguina]
MLSACSEAWRHAWVASSEQPLRGLLRPRPRFSRLPFDFEGVEIRDNCFPIIFTIRPSLNHTK